MNNIARCVTFFDRNSHDYETGFTFLGQTNAGNASLVESFEHLDSPLLQDVNFSQFKRGVELKVLYQLLLKLSRLETFIESQFETDLEKFLFAKLE